MIPIGNHIDRHPTRDVFIPIQLGRRVAMRVAFHRDWRNPELYWACAIVKEEGVEGSIGPGHHLTSVSGMLEGVGVGTTLDDQYIPLTLQISAATPLHPGEELVIAIRVVPVTVLV